MPEAPPPPGALHTSMHRMHLHAPHAWSPLLPPRRTSMHDALAVEMRHGTDNALGQLQDGELRRLPIGGSNAMYR